MPAPPLPTRLLGSGLPTCLSYSSDSLWPFPGETSMIPRCLAASVGPTAGRGRPPGPGSPPENRRKQMGVTRACRVEVILPLELRSRCPGQAQDSPFLQKGHCSRPRALLCAWHVLLCPLYIPRDPAPVGLLRDLSLTPTQPRPSQLPVAPAPRSHT